MNLAIHVTGQEAGEGDVTEPQEPWPTSYQKPTATRARFSGSGCDWLATAPRRSNPRNSGTPSSRTVAVQMNPRFAWMTCSALNGSHRPSLISPCIFRRTAEASGVPGAMACSRYRRAGSGKPSMRVESNASAVGRADRQSVSSIVQYMPARSAEVRRSRL